MAVEEVGRSWWPAPCLMSLGYSNDRSSHVSFKCTIRKIIFNHYTNLDKLKNWNHTYTYVLRVPRTKKKKSKQPKNQICSQAMGSKLKLSNR